MANKEPKQEKSISINLNCYTIRFRKKKEKEFLGIKEVFAGRGFKSIIDGFIHSIDTEAYMNESQDRILYLEKTLSFDKEERIYTGIINKGHSGHEAYVAELKGRKANRIGVIKKEHFSYIPFFFMLSQPEENSKAMIFIAQSYKQFGFKEVFEEAFINYFRTVSSDYVCEIAQLSISSLFKKYLNEGNVRKLRFINHQLPESFENILGEEDDKDINSYEVELSIKAKKKGFLGMKKKVDVGSSSFIEIFKFKDFEYEEALADVSINGRKRVLNIADPSKFSASFDVTDKSNIDKVTNHPDFEKLKVEAISILKQEILPTVK